MITFKKYYKKNLKHFLMKKFKFDIFHKNKNRKNK